MKKTKIMLTTAIAGFTVLAGVIGGVKLAENKSTFSDAAHKTYTVTIDNTNKFSDAEKTAKSFTRNTGLGNPITFTFSALNVRTETQWFAQLASGTSSHLENSTMISGIERITIKSQFKANGGGYTISAGASSTSLDDVRSHTSTYSESDIVTTTFEYGGQVNYFKIANASTSCGTYINSLIIEFSCIAADGTRDAKENASGDLLAGAYLNKGSVFEEAEYSYNMRSTDVNGSDSGYCAKFSGNAGTAGWPCAQIELSDEIDLRGYGLTFDIKLVNAYNWYAFSALDSNENYIIRSKYGGINVNPTLNLGNYVSTSVSQEDINDASFLEPGRTISDLAHVKYLVFTFNFEDAQSASASHEVTIDNIKCTRGTEYAPPSEGRTYMYENLGRKIPLTETIAFDIKFDNPTVHQEVGFCFYEEDWGNYFGQYWIDIHDTKGVKPEGMAYFEGNYAGLKVLKLSDGFFRVYADLSKLNEGNNKPTAYVEYIFFQAPNTVSNRGSGRIDILPVGRVYAPKEIMVTDVAFTAGTDYTYDLPVVRSEGNIIAEFTFGDTTNKAGLMVGNWSKYSGYYDLRATSVGQVYDGVYAESTGSYSIRVTFEIGNMTKGSSYADVVSSGGYKLLYIKGGYTGVSGTVSLYFQYR